MNTTNTIKVVNQPVRVELSHLQIIQGVYFLNDVLFTGLAYDHRQQKLFKVYQITEGKITAEQDFGFFKHAHPVKIDYDVVIDEYENGDPLYYHGKLFNGVTYEYKDGFVFSEALWNDGYSVETIGWFPDGSGLIYLYETNYHNDKCKFEWNYKQLVNIDCRKGDVNKEISFTIKINDKNQIKSYVLSADNMACLDKLISRDDIPLPANSLSGLLADYPLAEEIFLNIFSDHDFNYFMHHADFRSIKKLKLSTQNLSLPVLNKLMDLPNLQSIFLDEDRISRYQLADLPEKERAIKQQQCDERNHALLQLLFALQAQQNCDIQLNSRSGLLFFYSKQNSEIIADVNQNDFNFLFNALPLEQITELELRQHNLPVELLAKLAQLSHLKKLSIKEKKEFRADPQPTDNQTQNGAYQRREARNQALWTLLIHLQSKLHCDIKLISETLQEFEKRYQG
ncbi:hypothetical protein J3U21_09870 [Gilliamella sp. B2776]|uniref:hypothetical protein n=1 Tax=unclassified Gilliamella TaxID=2685620 RepID=UPI002269E2CA|nr:MULTISPECIES: hypothetical protein [unclassified Gilliamella]MCX8650677.1 hypothetical protein [Gilliamella sp. B2779]MCX8692458.1 hypothetical protein [Gilliamella sp. B2776]MCX8703679.1 hypothetical protein [Gilliamella sp. B2781]WDM18960.1 hypothetical protein J4T76_01040 [Gilliamella sp. B3022]